MVKFLDVYPFIEKLRFILKKRRFRNEITHWLMVDSYWLLVNAKGLLYSEFCVLYSAFLLFSLTLAHFRLFLSSRNVETPTDDASLRSSGKIFRFFPIFPSTFTPLDTPCYKKAKVIS